MHWWFIDRGEYRFDYIGEAASPELLAEARAIGVEITDDAEITACETVGELARLLDYTDCACSGNPSGAYDFCHINGVLMDELLDLD